MTTNLETRKLGNRGRASSGMRVRIAAVTLTFTGTLDPSAVTASVDRLTDLVESAEVADAWDRESALAG